MGFNSSTNDRDIWAEKEMSNTPLLQLRQIDDDIPYRTKVDVPFVYFHHECEEWVQHNQEDSLSAPDLITIFVGNYPIPDWMKIVSSRSLGIGGIEVRMPVVENGAHPVDVYGKTCTWYHYREKEDVKEEWPIQYGLHPNVVGLGTGLVMLNKEELVRWYRASDG